VVLYLLLFFVFIARRAIKTKIKYIGEYHAAVHPEPACPELACPEPACPEPVEGSKGRRVEGSKGRRAGKEAFEEATL
jgi:hypothetical protein